MQRALVLAVILTSSIGFAQAQRNYIRDNSDWWSLLREDSGPEIEPKAKNLDTANFTIAGVELSGTQFKCRGNNGDNCNLKI